MARSKFFLSVDVKYKSADSEFHYLDIFVTNMSTDHVRDVTAVNKVSMTQLADPRNILSSQSAIIKNFPCNGIATGISGFYSQNLFFNIHYKNLDNDEFVQFFQIEIAQSRLKIIENKS